MHRSVVAPSVLITALNPKNHNVSGRTIIPTVRGIGPGETRVAIPFFRPRSSSSTSVVRGPPKPCGTPLGCIHMLVLCLHLTIRLSALCSALSPPTLAAARYGSYSLLARPPRIGQGPANLDSSTKRSKAHHYPLSALPSPSRSTHCYSSTEVVRRDDKHAAHAAAARAVASR